jgi:hypothetical protein
MRPDIGGVSHLFHKHLTPACLPEQEHRFCRGVNAGCAQLVEEPVSTRWRGCVPPERGAAPEGETP